MTFHDRATTVSARQKAATDFAHAGYALFGPDWKGPLAAALKVRSTSIDDMSTGRSRIPPNMWNEIAGLIQDRERQFPVIRGTVLEHAAAPFHRLYRGPGGIEFRIFPSVDGSFPTVQYSDSWPMGWWGTLPENERRLPDNTAAFRMEYDGVRGDPVEVRIGGRIRYPSNFKPVE